MISLDQVMPNPNNIFTGVSLVALRERHTKHYELGKETPTILKLPFHIEYQTPDQTCFSRNSMDEIDLTRAYDLISLNPSLLQPGNHLDLEFRIIMHYPGQLLRSFDNPSYVSTLASYDKHKLLNLKVSHVTTLRKRPASNVRCNEKIENDDMVLLQEIMFHCGCVPPYWKTLVANTQGLEECHSSQQLQNLSHEIENYRNFFSNYDQPCVDMTAMVMINKDVNQDYEKNLNFQKWHNF